MNHRLEIAREVAIHAGERIMELYQKDFKVGEKADMSPITEADLLSNKIIEKELKKEFPDIPILSEESAQVEYSERKDWKAFWLVDPLDGTKEYIGKNGEFTVNIALIENGTPTIGVVYAPAKRLIYWAAKELGAYKMKNGENPQRLPIKAERENYVIAVSRSHQNQKTKDYIKEQKKIHEDLKLIESGSSLKMCLVAEGVADEYPRFGTTMEWDTAAAHAIVNSAGKKIKKIDEDKEITYNKDDLTNPWFKAE